MPTIRERHEVESRRSLYLRPASLVAKPLNCPMRLATGAFRPLLPGYDGRMSDSNMHSSTDQRPLGAPEPQAAGTTEKDPGDWVTGDEPMTGAQRSYLDTLAREAGEQLSPDLTKAEASEHIERLQSRTGRGADDSGTDGPTA